MACVYGRDGELDEEWLEYYGEESQGVEWRLVARLGCASPPDAAADAATADAAADTVAADSAADATTTATDAAYHCGELGGAGLRRKRHIRSARLVGEARSWGILG